jgi:prepilin peptidase CpaA
MPRSDVIPLIAAAFITMIAAATDIRRFKVYNALTVPALIGGLLISAWLGGLAGLSTSLMGAFAGFGVLVVFYALGGVGAGDVKLFAAIGAWLGPVFTLEVFTAASMAAAAYALILAVMQGGLGVAFVRLTELGRTMLSPRSWEMPRTMVVDEVRRTDRRRRLVPFAAMTCLAFFATLGYRHLAPGHEGMGRSGNTTLASSASHGRMVR